MKNRHGQKVELDNIKSVQWDDNGGCAIDRDTGWGTFHLSAQELDGFKPEVGDAIVMFTTNFSWVRGVIIENHVIRYMTAKDVEKDSKQMRDRFRLEKLERYVGHGESLKQRAKNLSYPLAQRMKRFEYEAENSTEFWINSAPYEMACLEGANALLKKVDEHGFINSFMWPAETGNDTDSAVKWIENWWELGYEEQMKVVPDFGDGHSGYTSSAGKSIAIAVLKGTEI